MRIMEAALPQLNNDPLRLGFASFTRPARAEAVGRASAAWDVPPSVLEKDGWFRTVHSTCKRCLNVQGGQLVTDSQKDIEWISNALGVKLSTELDDDSGRQRFIGDPTVAGALNCWSLCRVTLLPLEEIVRRMRRVDDSVPDFAAIVRIADRYEMAKRVEDRLDFTDLLLRFAGISVSPSGEIAFDAANGELPDVSAWLFDEQQDASPLLDAVCKRLISAPSVKWCYVVGDPFQCQPAGTPVLTTNGYKPIEKLDPDADRLIAFNKGDGRFYGTGGGVRFTTASRVVDSGDLIEVTFSDGTVSVCTANHKWLVRTNRRDAYATYIMRKGSRWRVGTVQMFAKWTAGSSDKNGDFRLKTRMNQEAADAAWVLRVFDTDREARMYEQVVSCRYGIPQVTFRPPSGCKNNLDAGFIDGVFDALGNLTDSGVLCLVAHGLEVAFPFCVKADRAKNGSKACRFLQAANLLPGIHVVPKIPSEKSLCGFKPRDCEWLSVASVRRLTGGEAVRVYSLEVDRHHTYVTTNGVVTGNSIYGFAGSSADCFLGWPADKQRIMPKSYRCPAPVLELGERCLRRMSRGYFDRGVAPADHDGAVAEADSLDDLVSLAKPDEDWLFIARTNYHARRMFAALQARHKPCRWAKSADGATARGDGLRTLFTLERNGVVSGKDWAKALALLPVKNKDGQPILARGTKTKWAAENADRWDAIFQNELESVGAEPALVEAIRTGAWCRLVDHGFTWRQQAVTYGPELTAEPRIRVGTVHSVKGAEADHVAFLTTIGNRVEQGMENPEQADEEHRIAYVAVTRARRTLHVINEGKGGRRVPRMEVL